MTNIHIAFLITIIAGLSTMLGTIPVLFPLKNKHNIITISLAFASGVMLCVSIVDLIPEALNILKEELPSGVCLLVFLFIGIGIFTSHIIDKTFFQNQQTNSLYKVGIISMLAIILHNIPEGIVTFVSTTQNTSLGLSLAIAIAIHNIPEGISISIPIYYATKNKLKAITYTLLSALSEPLGAILTYFFLTPIINDYLLGILFSFTAGIMIYISLEELLPTSYEYHNQNLSHLSFILGIIFMLLKFLL